MRGNRRIKVIVTVTTLLLFASIALAISIGAVKIHLFNMSEVERSILLHVRLPRVLLAGLVGAALVFSGALFQYVMKNPLADSFTTGVSASSAMGAVTAIMLGFERILPLFALAGGLTGLTAVYKISSVKGRIQPVTMLLAGIVVSTFSSASISFMKYLSDDSVSSIIFWLMGGFSSASMSKVITLAVVLIVSYLVIRRDFLSLDLICFDDMTAEAGGVDVGRLRRKVFFIAALLTAFSVGYAGIIGFAGLVIPHIIRLMRLVKAYELIPMSLLGGALFMIVNDLIARVILPDGQELPVGILTSFIGGLFFLSLLIKRKKELYYFD